MGLRLRAPREDEAALLESWHRDPESEGEFNDFGRPPEPASGTAGPTAGHLVVEIDGEAAGTVSWHETRYGPNDESRAFNIGIALLPAARGQGHGSVAQRLLADQLFATTSVNRVEASTDVDNVAEQRSLEKAGFAREGVLRGAQFRHGAWHDLISYARLRSDT
jgi:RimJ/RimL family protein N-acetyltransferase